MARERETPATASKPRAASGRLIHIDGARGYLLAMMFLAHFSFAHWTPAYYLHHGNYTPVFDGEFFVLLSGFVCALSYWRPFEKAGMLTCQAAVLRRVRWVYLYQVTVALMALALFMAMAPVEPLPDLKPDPSTPFAIQILQSFSLAKQPPYLDILVLYMALMLFIPLAFKLLSSGRKWLYFSILGAFWLVSWLQLDAAAGRWIEANLFDWSGYFRLRGHFNPLSYALIFYGGFFLGYGYKRHGHDAFVSRTLPARPTWFALAAATTLFFAVAEIGKGMFDTPLRLYDPLREEIGPVGLIGLSASAYVVYYLLVSPSGRLSWFQTAADRFFRFPLFTLLGQSSLFVYSAHILAVFLASYVIIVAGWSNSYTAILLTMVATGATIVMLAWLKKRYLPALP
jgi:hypothetical protein